MIEEDVDQIGGRSKMGKVYIVGAGPGDPDLLTIKALKAIQTADVILYDRLVNKQILQHAKEGADLIYCGKLPDYHMMKQETINHFLVKYAKRENRCQAERRRSFRIRQRRRGSANPR